MNIREKVNKINIVLLMVGIALLLFSPISTGNILIPERKYVVSKRQEITFILGDDFNTKNPFYFNTELFYRFNEKGKTDLVITHCRSLSEVQDYLINNSPKNNQAWGLINLVSHGNQYTGLSVKVSPKGKRANTKRVREGIDNKTLSGLPENIIDQKTHIKLHGCGIGNNSEFLEIMKSAFSNNLSSPKLTASNHFEYYVSNGNNTQEINMFLAKYWIVNFKKGYQPNDRILARKFANKYPDANINWKQALQSQSGSKTGDVFNYTFTIPVKWVFRYDCKDSVPQLDTKSSRLNWAKQNQKIIEDLKKLDIPPEKFNWWMRNIYVKNEDGTKTPALWVKGYCTSLCVLKLLPEEENTIFSFPTIYQSNHYVQYW